MWDLRNWWSATVRIHFFLNRRNVLFSVVGQRMTSQRCPCPDPQTQCICYRTWLAKGTLQMWSRLWIWDGEIILDYPGKANLIIWVSYRETFQAVVREKCEGGRRVKEMQCFGLWKWRKGPWAKECNWPLVARKGKKINSPLEPSAETSPADTLVFSSGRPTEDFWLPKQQICAVWGSH